MIEIIEKLCSIVKTQSEAIMYLASQIQQMRELTEAEKLMVEYSETNKEPLN